MNVSASAGKIRSGVFVTGTDTDVGKTLVSAILAKAWGADYWKPYQTGVESAPGDTETVAALLGPSGGHVLHPPACVLRAPLAPWAAARLRAAASASAAAAVSPQARCAAASQPRRSAAYQASTATRCTSRGSSSRSRAAPARPLSSSARPCASRKIGRPMPPPTVPTARPADPRRPRSSAG